MPPEVYDLFGNAQKKGEKAEEEWKATMAKYQEKYPEVRAGLEALFRPPLWHTLHPVGGGSNWQRCHQRPVHASVDLQSC